MEYSKHCSEEVANDVQTIMREYLELFENEVVQNENAFIGLVKNTLFSGVPLTHLNEYDTYVFSDRR